MQNHRRVIPPWPPWLAMAAAFLALLLLAGCGGYYVNPGASPARVRVQLDCTADRSLLPQDGGEVSPLTFWDWGLYLVAGDGRLLPLAPQSGEWLHGEPGERLVAHTVFLVPPGRQRLRLLVEGYVRVRLGMSARPYGVALLQEDLELDLAPGQEVAISRVKAGRQ
ncbi:MAG: hypothetical protein HY794_09615 [Desulfarculus sp.]|nr:hypothetical protein [Desulfarculus sp.]